jgi:CO/xanthine dehydrogenase Mo-binding subunit
MSGYKKPKPQNIGRGLALAEWSSSGGEGTVFVKIDAQGKVIVASPVLDQGAGIFTVMCEVVAEELRIPAHWVILERLDSRSVPSDTGVGGSRATQVYGSAAYEAAIKARQAMLAIAAGHLGVGTDELKLANGFVADPKSRRRMSFAEIVKVNKSPIEVRGRCEKPANPRENSIAAQIVEVQVDHETGQIKLMKLVSAYTTGKVINPLMHQGQIDGGIICGLGYATTEQLAFDDGKVTTTNFGEYKIPTIRDVPVLKTAVFETVAKGRGPYQSMSIGEAANLPIAAAVANAVEDALGVRIKSLPITADKIYAALHDRNETNHRDVI